MTTNNERLENFAKALKYYDRLDKIKSTAVIVKGDETLFLSCSPTNATIKNNYKDTKYSVYPVVIPLQPTAQEMVGYFLQGAMEDEELLYMSSPLDPKKEFVMLIVATRPIRGNKKQNIDGILNAFAKILEEEGVLETLNIQCVVALPITIIDAVMSILNSVNLHYLTNIKNQRQVKVLFKKFKDESLNDLELEHTDYSNLVEWFGRMNASSKWILKRLEGEQCL